METSREHLCPCCEQEKDLNRSCARCGNNVCKDCYNIREDLCDDCVSYYRQRLEKD